MGCINSSRNRIEIQHTFTSEEILYLTQSWNILKAHDITKFADEVLLRTINQNPSFRQFWTSKLNIEANNYDFSQGESCLRTDISWHIGLREYSVQFILIFNKLLSSINDENLFLTQIQSLRLLPNLYIFEYDSFMIMKQYITEVIREYFQTFKYNYTIDYEKSWNKFLSFIIKHLLEKDNQIQGPTKIIISPATIIDQRSSNILNSKNH